MRQKNGHKPKDKAERIGRADCQARLEELQVGLNRLARWLQHSGKRVLVLVEGRDTAGKGAVTCRRAPATRTTAARATACSRPRARPTRRGRW